MPRSLHPQNLFSGDLVYRNLWPVKTRSGILHLCLASMRQKFYDDGMETAPPDMAFFVICNVPYELGRVLQSYLAGGTATVKSTSERFQIMASEPFDSRRNEVAHSFIWRPGSKAAT